MTYNIHSCVNMDGQVLPNRIINVFRPFDPDVIALQEVDACIPLSAGLQLAINQRFK